MVSTHPAWPTPNFPLKLGTLPVFQSATNGLPSMRSQREISSSRGWARERRPYLPRAGRLAEGGARIPGKTLPRRGSSSASPRSAVLRRNAPGRQPDRTGPVTSRPEMRTAIGNVGEASAARCRTSSRTTSMKRAASLLTSRAPTRRSVFQVWHLVAVGPAARSMASFGSGKFAVGHEIVAGQYQSNAVASNCY